MTIFVVYHFEYTKHFQISGRIENPINQRDEKKKGINNKNIRNAQAID